MCAQLTSLSISSNPVSATPHLRRKVAAAVPHLQFLDDVPLDAHDRQVREPTPPHPWPCPGRASKEKSVPSASKKGLTDSFSS